MAKAGSVGKKIWLGSLLVGRLGQALPVAFFNAAHGSEKMGIGSCTEAFRLAVEHLHYQRVENTDLLQ